MSDVANSTNQIQFCLFASGGKISAPATRSLFTFPMSSTLNFPPLTGTHDATRKANLPWAVHLVEYSRCIINVCFKCAIVRTCAWLFLTFICYIVRLRKLFENYTFVEVTRIVVTRNPVLKATKCMVFLLSFWAKLSVPSMPRKSQPVKYFPWKHEGVSLLPWDLKAFQSGGCFRIKFLQEKLQI